jgi:hypothetical protein
VGCESVGELAKGGGQLLADQVQEWMGFRTTSKELVLQVSKKGIKGSKGLG